MDRLSAADLRTILGVARELGAVEDAEQLNRCLLPQLRRVVTYDHASFNVISPEAGTALIAATDPLDCRMPDDNKILGAYAHQNPLIGAGRRDPASVVKFSDFITRAQLHRLDIYDFVYRPTETEYQIAFMLPAPARHVLGVALNRRRGDFSERDRAALRAVRPFVVQAYERAAARAVTAGILGSLERGLDARREGLGLTERESEVLELVAWGHSNLQIARELAVSRRTIDKHLEHVYAKLGVASRTEAVARARNAAGVERRSVRASSSRSVEPAPRRGRGAGLRDD